MAIELRSRLSTKFCQQGVKLEKVFEFMTFISIISKLIAVYSKKKYLANKKSELNDEKIYVILEGVSTTSGGIALWFRSMILSDLTEGKKVRVISNDKLEKIANVKHEAPQGFLARLINFSQNSFSAKVCGKMGFSNLRIVRILFALHVINAISSVNTIKTSVVIPIYGGIGGFLHPQIRFDTAMISTSIQCVDPLAIYERQTRRKYGTEIFLESRAIKNASKIVCISEYTRREVVANFEIEQREVFTRNPKIEDPVASLKKPDDLIALSDKRLRDESIVFIGRYEWRKGTDILLNFWKQNLSNSELESTELICVGFQKSEIPTEYRSVERVSFLGQVTEERKFELLSKAFAVILPSRYESFGLVQIESAAFGTPVISSGRGALGSVANNLGLQTLIFDVTEPDSLTTKVVELKSDEQYWTNLSRISRERFETLYSL